MRIIKFKISGPLAHFRKFYTNSSSLSYDFPPRTVAMGTVAAIVGFERNSYYEKLSSENFDIAIKIATKNIKTSHPINNIRIKSPNDIYKQNVHTSIPTEYITPSEDENNVSFDIFISGKDSILNTVKDKLMKNEYEYPLYLGSAYCGAYAEFVYDKEGEEIYSENYIKISSVIPFENVKKINFKDNVKLLKDVIPIDFKEDRSLKKTSSVLYEKTGKPIEIIYSSKIIKIGGENIIFLK